MFKKENQSGGGWYMGTGTGMGTGTLWPIKDREREILPDLTPKLINFAFCHNNRSCRTGANRVGVAVVTPLTCPSTSPNPSPKSLRCTLYMGCSWPRIAPGSSVISFAFLRFSVFSVFPALPLLFRKRKSQKLVGR